MAFLHEEDKRTTMPNRPWFIYDHYLTVRDWRPNFPSESNTIEEVAVWIRITWLHIEYYDARGLSLIGNKVGRSVKVDKNTMQHEIHKYSRICVVFNLSKPLLVMF